jgi:hypothetical protein
MFHSITDKRKDSSRATAWTCRVLVVRGIVGVSSLMSGEIDVTCHAGSGFSAALRGLPLKINSVTRDRPIHELVIGSFASSTEIKGKSIAVGLLEGTAAS